MFNEMNESIQEGAVRLIMRARFMVNQPFERKQQASNLSESHEGSATSGSDSPGPDPRKVMDQRRGRTPEAANMRKQLREERGQSGEQATQSQNTEPAKRDYDKVGRNDPCPCGSGKKYKNCHGAN